ncbi:MAG: hypothetical protein M3139_06965 [Bacteroidota bacterium]|nr:hypothetical protein [Bacteroidota bacterium]
MKILGVILLILSVGTTMYFFVIEQFKGVVLTKSENTILSVSYLITGVSIIILAGIKFLEKKNE